MKRRWFRFLRRRQRDEEMAREIASYVDHETADNIARGMGEREARSAAIRKFGNRMMHRETDYEMSSVLVVDSIWRHVTYGVRQLRRTPGFTITAILSLALGIGANTAIFQLLDAVRLRSLPVQRPGELAAVVIDGGNHFFGSSAGDFQATHPLWEQVRDHQEAFSSVFAWGAGNFAFGEAPRTRRIRAIYASGGMFATLGVNSHRGRLFGEEDDRKGCALGPAVISHRMWQSEFGGQESAVGARIVINGKPMEVVGIAPPEFFGLEVGRGFDVAIPNCTRAAWGNILDQRHVWNLNVIGRLKPDWTMERAAEYLKTASPAWFSQVPPTGYDAKGLQQWARFRFSAAPGGSGVSELRSQYERSLWLLLGVTGLVLLIACANLANLLLARAASREREVAVRMAIGATRGQIIGQLLTESLLLASTGALFAAGLAQLFSQLLVQFLSTKGNTVLLDMPVDWRVLGFVTAVGLLTCLFFGLAPALKASRADAYSAMKSGGRGTTADRGQFSMQRVLIACQIAVSLMLVAGAFLFVRSFHNLMSVDAGFRQDGLVFNFINFSALRPSREAVRPLQREMLEKVRSIPGIEAASTSTHFPLSGSSWTIAVRVPGSEQRSVTPQFTWVSPDYFKTMQVPLRAGRDINDGDGATTRKVMMVNERFVKDIFAGADPIGKTIQSLAEPGFPAEQYEVVGVVADTRYADLRTVPPAIAYLPELQNPQFGPGMAIVTRSSIPTAQATAAVRRVITEGYAAANMEQVELRAMVSERLLRERLLAWVSGFFGLLAIGLATIGLYGVVSHMAARRENEIGIRMAMGASGRDVVGLLLRDVALLFAVGVPVGIAGSLALTRGVSKLLYGVEPGDPLVLGLAAVALLITGIVATLIPSTRASRLDPVKCLRAD